MPLLLLLIHDFTFGPFWGPLLSRATKLMPSRVAGNWAEVCFGVGIFALTQILYLYRLGWKEMQKRWGESVGIGVLSAALGWSALFGYSLFLEMRDIRVTASKIEAPKVYMSRPPRNWDQKTALLKRLENRTLPSFRGTIEEIFFLQRTEECEGVRVVVTANIINDGAPSIANIGQIRALLPNGKEIELTTIISPFEGIAVQGKAGETPIYLPAKDYFPIKAIERPIPTGGETYGWLWGCAKGFSQPEVENPASKIILPFTDFKGRSYRARAGLSDKQIEIIIPKSVH